jgi:hypothetical protein
MHFYGIWSHFEAFEVDKITNFLKKKKSFKEGRRRPFRRERGAGHTFFNWCEEHFIHVYM